MLFLKRLYISLFSYSFLLKMFSNFVYLYKNLKEKVKPQFQLLFKIQSKPIQIID